MKCTNCGNDLGERTSGFCGSCGTKIEAPSDDRTVVISSVPEPESMPASAPVPAPVAPAPAPAPVAPAPMAPAPVAPAPVAPAPASAPAPAYVPPVAPAPAPAYVPPVAPAPAQVTPTPAPVPMPIPTPIPTPPDVPAPSGRENPLVKLFKEKPKAVIGGAAGVFVLLLVIILAATLGRSFNPPYNVIDMGRYDHIEFIGGDQFIVDRGRGFGVVNTRGNYIVEFGRFDDLADFSAEGTFVLQRGRSFYVINESGREIASFDRYDWVRIASDNRFIVQTGSGGNARSGVVDRRGNYIIRLGNYTGITPARHGNGF